MPTLPEVKKLIIIGGEPVSENELSYQDVIEMGHEAFKSSSESLKKARKDIMPDDPANICYTSGTTADPKGIVLSHRNYVANVNQSYSLMDIPSYYTTLLILPWDHAFAHTAGIYCMMGKGASIASVQVGKTGMETLKNIPINIRENRPYLLMSVPALAANFKKGIEKGIRDKGLIVNMLFKNALEISYLYNNDCFRKGNGLTFLFKPLIKLYDKIIFSKIRESFGGRLQFFIGGGALLDMEFQKFFYAIGMPMFQGYGLTEASPIISSNSLAKHKLGSSGHLVTDMLLKICDNHGNELPLGEPGEIVIKGENVMLGYWNNKEATDQTIKDGWLYTGDLGYMDADGFLYVLGRFKSLLIDNDGEKYSPEGIEETLIGQSHYIQQCMLHNNQNPYTIALLVPDAAALKHHLHHKGLKPETEEGLTEALNAIHHDLSHYKGVGKHHKLFPQRWLPAAVGILSEVFTEENHLLNTTMKMVRGKINEKYKNQISYLYTPEGKDFFNSKNKEALREILNKN